MDLNAKIEKRRKQLAAEQSLLERDVEAAAAERLNKAGIFTEQHAKRVESELDEKVDQLLTQKARENFSFWNWFCLTFLAVMTLALFNAGFLPGLIMGLLTWWQYRTYIKKRKQVLLEQYANASQHSHSTIPA